MYRRIACILIAIFFFSTGGGSVAAAQSSKGAENLSKAQQYVDQALDRAKEGKLSEAEQTYHTFNDTWLNIEDGIKAESGQAYKDIESNMGQVEYAFIQNKQEEVIKALQDLKTINEKFIQGQYEKGELKTENITLSEFITYLQQTKEKVQIKDQQAALSGIAKVRQSWLSVEGSVVSRSATIYNDSERDMVTVNAMLAQNPPNDEGAVQLLDRMVAYLTPLAEQTGYTIWDAALIPIREGLEALLVVAALLAFVSKSNSVKGKSWIWLGVSGGVLVSIILAIIVKFVFSSGAFGNNNFLISGWTGVIAALMLLYVSYWLHRQSNIKDWQQYIRSQTRTALDTGRLISLAVLSFLSVFREGTETVLFFIGMVNQISLHNLIIGIAIGLGILIILAYLMIIVGLKLPLRPFFLVSSVIVFYLCLKFTGMGVHSLQLAGLFPSTEASRIPSIDFIALYPSWESAIPQIFLFLGAVIVIVWRQIARNKALAPQSDTTIQ